MTGGDNAGVKLAFERESVVVAITHLVPLKTLRPGTKESKKYDQIVRSIRAIGLIEAPVVAPDPKRAGQYFLLDGHVRIEALKDLGIVEVECLISIDDETYTFNKRVNRLVPVQEHRMIVKAIERGVPENQIAEALGLEVTSVRRRSRMLDGVCTEAIELLKDSPCALGLFDFLRRMTPIRQVEAAELMVGQNNFTGIFAKALLVATPEGQLVDTRKKKPEGGSTVTSEQIAKMERELVSLQCQVKSVFTYTRLPPCQWKSARTTNAIERSHEEFKRRIKTQTVLPSAETAAMLLALLASGQISMRKIDGWQTLASKPWWSAN